MKVRKWSAVLRMVLTLAVIVVLGGFSIAWAAGTEQRYKLTDLSLTKSAEGLKTTPSGGWYYIGGTDDSCIGAWAEFTFSLEKAGSYEVGIATKKHNSKGIFQTSINGQDTGSPIDQYALSGSANQSVTVKLGEVVFTKAGDQKVRFTITGKNENVSTYEIAVEALVLTPLNLPEEPEIPEVTFEEPKVSESGQVVAYPMPYIYTQSNTFTVKADGLEIPVVDYRNEYDYGLFSMSGTKEGGSPVHVEITGTEAIQSYEISPKKLGIEAEVSGNTLSFDLEQPEYLIIRLNGKKRLALAADAKETDVPEKTGTGIFNILEEPYKAERTGTKLSTEAIQKAIDDASAYGTAQGNGKRGIVYVPNGVYQTASLVMKSNMEIYLEGGAVLRATLDGSKYPIRGRKNSIGKDVVQLIYTENNKLAGAYHQDFQNPDNFIESENMRIYGRGTVDGRGRDLEKATNLLIQSMIPVNCSNFTADGIVLRDTSIWSVAPGLSRSLTLCNLKVLNTFNHEDDCIDINGCQDVLVKNVIGIALDDPFSTKTWETGELFQAWCGEPEGNDGITFEDCLSWSYCYGFKVGQGSWRDQKNIVFRNGTVYDCAVGLGVHHKYGTAELSGIAFENIDIEHISSENDGHRTWLHMQAITSGSDGKLPIHDVRISNINVYDKGKSTAKLIGYDNTYKIQGIKFENIYMDEAKKNAETLDELDIKDLFYYCTDLSVDGKKLPDAPAVYMYQLEDLIADAERSENCPEITNSDGYAWIGKNPGDWASFPIEMEAGTYKLEVLMKKHDSKGIFQMYVNDEPIGDPYDQYYNGNKTGVTENFGTVTFEKSGTQHIKFEITGKNTASKGYQLVLDAVKLSEIDSGEKHVLESLEIKNLPVKTTYYIGEKADYTGLSVAAVYKDGSREILGKDQYRISGFDSKNPGKITLTITYEEKTAEFTVEITEMSEELEEALDELEDRIASASNAASIEKVAEDAFEVFDRADSLTEKVMDLVKKLETAVVRFCESIKVK